MVVSRGIHLRHIYKTQAFLRCCSFLKKNYLHFPVVLKSDLKCLTTFDADKARKVTRHLPYIYTSGILYEGIVNSHWEKIFINP